MPEGNEQPKFELTETVSQAIRRIMGEIELAKKTKGIDPEVVPELEAELRKLEDEANKG